jgi:hypothetical protein
MEQLSCFFVFTLHAFCRAKSRRDEITLEFKPLTNYVVASRRLCSSAAKQSPVSRGKIGLWEIASSGRTPSSQRHDYF